jgi:putative peptidoglycan lipid II flippase
MSHLRDITRSSLVISLFTFLSRLLGMVRDILRAEFFGTSPLAKAFIIAFKIPNILRRLVAEGALSQAFIPVFAEYLRSEQNELKARDKAMAMANAVISVVLVLLLAIVILGELLAPWIVRVLSSQWEMGPTLDLTIDLTRYMFPYIMFVSLASLFMGILNSFKHFAAPALSPVVLNIAIISVYLLVFPFFEDKETQIRLLSIGVIVGGLLQLSLQIAVAYRKGYRFRFNLDWHHPAIKKIFTIMLPAVFGAGVYQFNQIIDLIIASYLEKDVPGAVASLEYANRLMQLPLGVFGIAISTAILPTLSLFLAEGKKAPYKKTLMQGYALVAFITLPAMAGLVILAEPIIVLILERGAFDAYSTSITVYPLIFYSLGILSYSAIKITVAAFFSLKDSKTPVVIATFILAFNLIQNLIYIQWMDHRALALSASIGAAIHWGILIHMIKKRLNARILGVRRIIVPVAKTILATAIMASVLYILHTHPPEFANLLGRFWVLILIALGGII